MDETEKKILLLLFVILILNTFYCITTGNYLLIVWVVITLMVGYFSVYPDKFFHCLDNAREYINNYRRNSKGLLHSYSIYQRTRSFEEKDIEKNSEGSSSIPNSKLSR
ncbi:MAG TPA: hypothetical protein EYH22_02980 [Candidatus Nanopusillus sp.]|nr:hypothetical protein [Candidatus Nanopusillus sp.]